MKNLRRLGIVSGIGIVFGFAGLMVNAATSGCARGKPSVTPAEVQGIVALGEAACAIVNDLDPGSEWVTLVCSELPAVGNVVGVLAEQNPDGSALVTVPGSITIRMKRSAWEAEKKGTADAGAAFARKRP